MVKDLRRAATGGVMWTASAQTLRQGMQVVVTAVLAWHLAPEDFGLLGMVSVALALVAPLNEMGMGAALVQKKDLEPGHAATVFWSQLVVSSAVAGLLALAAPLVASFFLRAELTPLLRVMCLGVPVGAAAAAPQALLLRGFQFKRVAAAETIALGVAGGVAIGLAMAGWGVWCLVAQSLTGTCLTTLLFLRLSRFNPIARGAAPRRSHLKEFIGFGGPLTGYQFLNFLSRNIDDVLIGRFLGAGALGYYTMAYRIMMFPLQKVSDVVSRVSFPTFSALQGDLARMRRAYLKGSQFIALITFPMMAAMMIVAPAFIAVVFGPAWAPVAPLVVVLSLAGMTASVGTTVGSIFLARGRTDLMLKWGAIASSCFVIAIVIGLRWGIMGVTVSYTATAVVLWPFSQALANRLIDLKLSEFFRVLAPPAALAALIAAALLAVRLVWFPSALAAQALFLAACGLVGAAIVAAAAAIGRPAAIAEMLALARQSLAGWRAAGSGEVPPG